MKSCWGGDRLVPTLWGGAVEDALHLWVVCPATQSLEDGGILQGVPFPGHLLSSAGS